MRLLIAGAGGHGCVVADTAAAGEWLEIAFVDDRYPEIQTSGFWPIIGRLEDLERLRPRFDACVSAFGDAKLRLEVVARALAAGFALPAIVHPRATVSARAVVEAGSVVFAGGVVNIGAVVGLGCIVNTGATIDHDCRLAQGVHVCPGVHLAGNVEVGARTWIGIGAVAKEGIRLGADVTVGAGAVCLDHVRDGVTVVGAPAREQQA